MADVTFTISIRDDGTPVLREIKKEAQNMGEGVAAAGQKASSGIASLTQSLGGLRGVLVSLGVTITVGQLLSLADSAKQLEGRLKLVTDSQSTLNQAMSATFQIAQQTRTDWEATTAVYSKLARNADQLGLSQEKLSSVTRTLNQLVRLSAASSEGAKNALFQLGQSIDGGTVRAEEFNSVLEQTPEIAQAIARGLGISMGELRREVNDGKLTIDRLSTALQNVERETSERFAQLPTTVGEAFIKLGNALLKFVGDLDKATGASSTFATVLERLAEGVEESANRITSKLKEMKIDRLREITQEINRLQTQIEAGSGARLSDFLAAGGADVPALIARIQALVAEQKALQQELTHTGAAAEKAGKQIGDGLTPAQRAANDEAKKLVDQLNKQTATLGLTGKALADVSAAEFANKGATKEHVEAVRQAVLALEARKAALAAAKKAEQEHEKAIRDAAKAEKDRLKDLSDAEDLIAKNAAKLEEIRRKEAQDLARHVTAVEAQIAAYQKEAQVFDEVKTGARGYDDALRDLAIAQKTAELQSKGLGDRSQELATRLVDAERAAQGARASVQDLAKASEGITFKLGDALADDLDKFLTGLAQGTRKASDLFTSLADVGIAAMSRLFAQTIREKITWETTLSGNLLTDLPALFSQSATRSGAGFLSSLLGALGKAGGIGAIAGTLTGSTGAGIGGALGSLLNSAGFGASFVSGLAVKAASWISRALGIEINAALMGVGKLTDFIIPGLGMLAGFLFEKLFDLFASPPTKGTQIRQGVEKWLKEIGVTFASAISEKNYFFGETNELAKKLFGNRDADAFLAASKQILREKVGPELAKEAQALGVLITADLALDKGKPVEQTATTFGNMIKAGLQKAGKDSQADFQAALEEIVSKGQLSFEAVTDKLTEVFKRKGISEEFYRAGIEGAIRLFTHDLPAGLDVAALAMKSFTDDGIFSLTKFKDLLAKAVEQTEALGNAFTQALSQGIASGQSREEVEKAFASLFKDALRSSIVQKFLADEVLKLFKDIDLTKPIDLSSSAFATLKERVGEAYDRLVDLLNAAGLLPEQLDKSTSSAEDLVNKIRDLQEQIRDLVNKRIEIRLQLLADLASIGFIDALDAITQRIESLQARISAFGVSPIATEPFQLLNDQDLKELISLQDQLRQAILSRYNEEARLIQENAQRQISALQEQRAEVQRLYQQQIQDLQKALAIAQEFGRVADSIDAILRQAIMSPASGLSSSQQLGALQREAAAIRQKLLTATGSERAALIQQLASILQQQLQFVDRNSVEGQNLFNKIIGELTMLRDEARKEGDKAQKIQEQIAETTAQMNAALASIDQQIRNVKATAEQQLAALREATAKELRDLADRQDAALKEQIRRFEAQEKTAREQLIALVGAEEAQKILAEGDKAHLIKLTEANVTLLSIDAHTKELVDKIKPAASGFHAVGQAPHLILTHPGERIDITPSGQSSPISGPIAMTFAPVVQVTVEPGGEGRVKRDIEDVLRLAEQRFLRKIESDWAPRLRRAVEGKI
jgi:tape measure domain-containing protein